MSASREGKPTWPMFEVRGVDVHGLERGLVHVLTGGGKGKSTASFGLILRASGHGMKCCLIQFMKKGEYGEIASLKRLPGVHVEQYGSGHWVDKRRPIQEDLDLARSAMESAGRFASSGDWNLVVLDEINVAIKRKLVRVEDVLAILEKKHPRTEVVLTGRGAPKALIDRADYVTMLVGMKHPYHKGVIARKGIEW